LNILPIELREETGKERDDFSRKIAKSIKRITDDFGGRAAVILRWMDGLR
jgi:hypothetical protein